MKVRGFHGNLPLGGSTNNWEEYIETWEKFTKPIEDLCGITRFAFDPRVSFISPDGKQTVQLPCWLIKLINEGLEKIQNDKP